jgi:pimeloyl-ACP methyl ester carboxylesterase
VNEYSRGELVFDVTDAGPPDGEVVVLLHGFPENRSSWDKVTPLLTAAGYRTLAPDLRGFARRARPTRRRDYAMREIVGDVLALVDASGAERVHVVGHDWGGAAAWAFAAEHPDRVRTLTSLTTPHPRALRASLVRSRQLLKSWYMVLFQLPWLPETGYGQRGLPMTRRALARSGLPEDAIDRYVTPLAEPGAARTALNWYRGIPFSPPVGPVTVPTLYVYATGDQFLARSPADLTANYVEGPYEYVVMEGATHWLPECNADDVARLVLAHARRHPS